MRLIQRINYSKTAVYLLMHAGATTCVFVETSWQSLAVALSLYLATGGLGWSVGIHRGLIHRSFKTYRWVENCLALLGAMSGLGGPISSSRTHFLRDYCQNRHGIEGIEASPSWWSNYWQLPFFSNARLEPSPRDEISDELEHRPFFRWLESRWWILGGQAALLYWLGGASFVAWGFFARIAITANVFAAFDYFCHSPDHGSQRFEVRGAPCAGRNHWLLAILTCGEGWHNNHHAMPQSPNMGITRGEFDFGYLMIRLLEVCGLAWDLVDPHSALKSNAHVVQHELTPNSQTV